ncbi:MAG: Spy/CpxP family protein refolding chaperone [Steroidobacteraceae bacterium]
MASIVMTNLPGRTWADAATGQAGAAAQTTKTSPSAATHGVDGLIAHLHEKFQITPAQESSFQKLADVMRENADTMSALAKKRAEGTKTSTAVDDLKSYSEISEAHTAGTKKMIPVFQVLYDSMSDAQKKAADDEFREHYAAHHRQKH